MKMEGSRNCIVEPIKIIIKERDVIDFLSSLIPPPSSYIFERTHKYGF